MERGWYVEDSRCDLVGDLAVDGKPDITPSEMEIALPGIAERVFPHDELVSPSLVGMDRGGLEKVVAAFAAQQSRGAFPGGQIAVRRHGQLVVDEKVGVARGYRADEGNRPEPVTSSTRFLVFSAGKPVIALAVAILEDRGLLDVKAPITEVWPEFGRNGKQRITTVDILTHRGGVLMPDLIRRHRDWHDWSKVVQAIVDVEPSVPRGRIAYHPFEFGWVLAEIVQRVTGRDFRRFVAEEIAKPAGLEELQFAGAATDPAQIAKPYWLGTRPVYVADVNVAALFQEVLNSGEILSAFVPGAGLVTNAVTLAGFYDLLLGGGRAASGARIVSERTLAKYTSREVFGWDHSNGIFQSIGRGFLLGTRYPSLYGLWNTSETFGHAGAFCTVAFADPKSGLAAALTTNGNRGPADLVMRFLPLCDGLRRACKK